MNRERRACCKRLLFMSIALSLGLALLAPVLAWWGKEALPDLSASLAEVTMARGAAREAAGALAEARVCYEQALAGRFHGEANRNHCEKRLGVVLLRMGEAEAALEHLSRAQASPLRSLNGFGPLVDALMALERGDDARRAAERWLEASGGDPGHRAGALQALGNIAMHEGDLDAAAARLNEAVALNRRHEARADLARLYAAQGDTAKARDTMIAFLASAPPNEETAAHWALLASWMP